MIINDMIKVLFKPKQFFDDKKELSMFISLKYILFVYIIGFIFWIMDKVISIYFYPYIDNSIFEYVHPFSSKLFIVLGIKFIVPFFELILGIFLLSTLIYLILKLFFKTIIFKDIFSISSFSLTPFILSPIVYLCRDVFNFGDFARLELFLYLYSLIILLFGLMTYLKFSKKNMKILKITAIIGSIIMIMLLSYFSLIEYQSKPNYSITNFYAKIGNETVFTYKDVDSVCVNSFCSGIQYCRQNIENYSCRYYFSITLSDTAKNKLNHEINLLSSENGKLSKTMDYYINNELEHSVNLDENLKSGIIIISISGTGKGITKGEALTNTYYKMYALVNFIKNSETETKNLK
jgi:hypothetical protein